MNDHRGQDSIFILLASLLLVLLLVAAGFIAWQWQRSSLERDLAVVARMEAEQQRQLAEETLAANALLTAEKSSLLFSDGATDSDEVAAIEGVLLAQQAAWNRGDIDAFMETYWRSDDLTFSSAGAMTRSWQSTLDRYKQKYSTRGSMGTLEFDGLEVHLIAPGFAYVLGRWDLKDIAGGVFTLLLKKESSGWVIIHDHTSADSN